MKPLVVVGIFLVVFGIFALAYNRISYTTEDKIAEIGPFTATARREKSIPLSPVLGGLALLAGAGMIAVGYRRSR